jgi:hypothetical protein
LGGGEYRSEKEGGEEGKKFRGGHFNKHMSLHLFHAYL